MGQFGKYLKSLLKVHKKTQAELARDIGLKRQNYIGNIVSGIHTPTIKRVEQIIQILQCSETEKRKLLDLAISERTPSEIKFYWERSTDGKASVIPANSFSDFTKPELLIKTQTARQLGEGLFPRSFIFKITSDFLSPFIQKGSRILLSLEPKLIKGYFFIFELNNKKNKYTEKINRYFKQIGSKITASNNKTEYVYGFFISKNKDSLHIANNVDTKYTASFLINPEDIIKTMGNISVFYEE